MQEVDFDKLNKALYAWTCKTEGCERDVAGPESFCMGCFMGLITEEVVYDKTTGKHIKIEQH